MESHPFYLRPAAAGIFVSWFKSNFQFKHRKIKRNATVIREILCGTECYGI